MFYRVNPTRLINLLFDMLTIKNNSNIRVQFFSMLGANYRLAPGCFLLNAYGI